MTETTPYAVTKGRHFSKVEQQMIWRKPASHQTSEEELRIASEIKLNWEDPEMKVMNVLLEGDAGSGKTQLARALSADLQLPYTKVTCFADMDKTDVFGALLPVVTADDETDNELLEAIYQADCLEGVLELIVRHYSISQEKAREKFAELIQRVTDEADNRPIQYKFYPSEIVRAIEKGYLLEIQEPTVIRDASVLVALNSALENNGILNIPTGIIRRHPDCVVIITTNRNYQGNRPLNESLRDRVQHAEKMDLPSIEVMMERAQAKTGFDDSRYLEIMAKIIRLLDETAKANAIKGVAGMRSYFFWVNSLKQGQNPLESIFPKVLYKLTTDENELSILSNALDDSGLLVELQQIKSKAIIYENKGRVISADEADERNITQDAEHATLIGEPTEEPANETESEQAMDSIKEEPATDPAMIEEAPDTKHNASDGESEKAVLSEEDKLGSNLSLDEMAEWDKQQRKELNRETRAVLKETIHAKEGTIVHRPKLTTKAIDQGKELTKIVLPEVESLSRVINDLLDKEESADYSSGKYYGSRFNPSRVAYGDLRNFDKKNPPTEQPSLALAVRVDESGSMVREDRIEKAKQAALALGLFAEKINIPFTLYGDSADVSQREKTSLFSYKEFNDPYDFLAAKIATMKPRQNNRDGVPLRLLAEKLSNETADTKLLLNISDGQPKALPDYTAKKAQEDIQQVLADYERKGIIFIACAIGEDKLAIKSIYGEDRFVDISDLSTMPQQLLQLISRFV
ncbi:AAA family ATPase [Enterococcus pallens]|uniref:ATP-dependent protease ATP-binding subunit ClpX n=1 Tax=Enterococcus pallens ATCC BAA-351 TaxID=1158607 RepID=R2Q0Z8_9ENTE|nr:AAA family ATPase [Enterococcus pallens]EOH90242.1 ATP-dependent protease ATP-binding subunit ClpX [Enterococcus pallens ATCC BAA-351]EOU15152.1 ATP-dependent protease ATP-binding subunit ClpX [Enterococcus pallens ATCC BAA-351]OJG79118.1 ATP-dependent protease ATP-binding subunit ClpX [Enterococcus pallens]